MKPTTPPTPWNKRLLESTRGRIVALLRRAARTVNELAETLDLTDNAVRAHLTTLERDGLVQQSGVRRGPRKPHQAYTLTPEAEQLFPKAYGPVLHELLDVLAERLTLQEREDALREVGRRLAAQHLSRRPRGSDSDSNGGTMAARLQQAVALLGELGGLAEAGTGEGGQVVIRGYSCPLAAAVPGYPEVCRLAETLLAEVVGAPVQERCEREASPLRCCFEVQAAETG